jgi:hypothetical protein
LRFDRRSGGAIDVLLRLMRARCIPSFRDPRCEVFRLRRSSCSTVSVSQQDFERRKR